jgi:hypothetical protein
MSQIDRAKQRAALGEGNLVLDSGPILQDEVERLTFCSWLDCLTKVTLSWTYTLPASGAMCGLLLHRSTIL